MRGPGQPPTRLPSLPLPVLLDALHLALRGPRPLALGDLPGAPLCLQREGQGEGPWELVRLRAFAALCEALRSHAYGELSTDDRRTLAGGRGWGKGCDDGLAAVGVPWDAQQRRQERWEQEVRLGITTREDPGTHSRRVMLWLPVLAPFLQPAGPPRGPAAPSLGGCLGRAGDGRGRLLVLLDACLRQMRVAAEGGGEFTCLRRLFTPTAVVGEVGRADSPLAMLGTSVEGRACRRLLHALRRLSHEGGVTLPVAREESDGAATLRPSEELRSPRGGEVDWLHAVADRARLALRSRGDFLAVDDTEATGPTLRAMVHGLVHHLLAAEVAGAALCSLEELLVDYLFAPGSAGEGGAGAAASLPAMVSTRLAWLLRYPHLAIQVAPPSLSPHGFSAGGAPTPFSAAARAAVCVCPAPVTASQLLPSHLIALAREDAGGGGGEESAPEASRAERQEWYALTSPPPPSAAAAELVERAHLRVLLLRIDPAGDWLPAEEDVFNTQTFFSYYANDIQTQRQRPGDTHALDSDSGEEDEGGVGGGQGGLRHVLAGSREQASPLPMSGPGLSGGTHVDSLGEATGDEAIVEQIVLAAGLSHGEAAADTHLLRSALRLYLFAVRHSVDVILTPERAPRMLRCFGVRYLPVLRALAGAPVGVCARHGAAATIRLTDRIRLQDFVALQSRLTTAVGSGVGAPLILCRDTLRAPVDVAGACPAVFAATHLVLAPPAHLLRARLSEVLPLVPPTDGPDAVAALVPAEPVALPHGKGQALCVVALPAPAHPHPTLLLAAPSAALAERHTSLLLKAAVALRTALDVDGGVVRAGGAALVSTARELRAVVAAAQASPVPSRCSPSPAPPDAGLNGVVLQVLLLLADACLAVPGVLAESVIAGAVPPDPGAMCARTATPGGPELEGRAAVARGPRARRRLWGLAVLAAMSTEPSAPHRPELHVHTRSTVALARARLAAWERSIPSATPDKFSGGLSASGATLSGSGGGDRALDVYAEALHVFAPAWGPEPGGEGMFVECFEDNVSLLRAAVHALYLILTASLTGVEDTALTR